MICEIVSTDVLFVYYNCYFKIPHIVAGWVGVFLYFVKVARYFGAFLRLRGWVGQKAPEFPKVGLRARYRNFDPPLADLTKSHEIRLAC